MKFEKEKQMSKIKLIALDMDGTLLRDDGSVSSYTKEIIKEALDQHIQVVLCTGRPLKMCADYAEALQLDSYLITCNGAEIWTVDYKLIERHIFPPGKVETLWQLGNKHNLHMWTVATDEIFRHSTRPADFNQHDWLKIGYGRLTEQMKTYLLNELKHDHTIEITNSSPSNLEINQIGVNKVHAVERLCQLSNISMQEVMAIGDSINDLKMLREVGLGVAVENAQEEILDIARVVTASNNDDGVAKAIKNYALT